MKSTPTRTPAQRRAAERIIALVWEALRINAEIQQRVKAATATRH